MTAKTSTEKTPPTPQQQLIRSLGGHHEVAKICDIDEPGRPRAWRQFGIPPQFHDRVLAAAAARDRPEITRDLLTETYKPPTNPQEIILQFGGRSALAKILGTTKNAVSNWYRSGIPAKHHRRVIQAAEDLGIPGVTAELLEATHTPAAARPKSARRICDRCGCTIVESADIRTEPASQPPDARAQERAAA